MNDQPKILRHNVLGSPENGNIYLEQEIIYKYPDNITMIYEKIYGNNNKNNESTLVIKYNDICYCKSITHGEQFEKYLFDDEILEILRNNNKLKFMYKYF